MRLGTISATLAVSCVLLAGCGSSSSNGSNSGGGGSSTPAASSSGSSTSSGSSGTTSSGSSGNFTSAQNCAQLAGVGSQFEKAIQAVTGKSLDLSGVATAYKNLADASPAAIKPDMETIAGEFGNFAAAVQKVGYTPGKVPTPAQIGALQSAVKLLDQSKLRTAETHIASWAAQNCHA